MIESPGPRESARCEDKFDSKLLVYSYQLAEVHPLTGSWDLDNYMKVGEGR